MLPDRVSNPRPLTYESGALPIASPFVKFHDFFKHVFVFILFPCFLSFPEPVGTLPIYHDTKFFMFRDLLR